MAQFFDGDKYCAKLATHQNFPFHTGGELRCCPSIFVTGFAKRCLVHASDFATLMSHNFVYD